MTMKLPLSGIIAALPTPFLEDGSVDVVTYVAMAQRLLRNGCDGLNLMGTTGEATSLSTSERVQLMQEVARSGLPLDKLIVGTGASAVPDAVALTKSAEELGFAGALVLPPFYYKGISTDGILSYIDAILTGSEADGIPILLYNFPALSGVAYEFDVIKELLHRHGDRIAGIKDSSNDLDYCRRVSGLSSDLAVYPSNEGSLLIGRDLGFAGCISATATLNSALCATALRNRSEEPLKKATAIRKIYDGLPLISAIKHTVSILSENDNWKTMRSPLVPLTSKQEELLCSRISEVSLTECWENVVTESILSSDSGDAEASNSISGRDAEMEL